MTGFVYRRTTPSDPDALVAWERGETRPEAQENIEKGGRIIAWNAKEVPATPTSIYQWVDLLPTCSINTQDLKTLKSVSYTADGSVRLTKRNPSESTGSLFEGTEQDARQVAEEMIGSLLKQPSDQVRFESTSKEEEASLDDKDKTEDSLKMRVIGYKILYSHVVSGLPISQECVTISLRSTGVDSVFIRWSSLVSKSNDLITGATVREYLDRNWDKIWVGMPKGTTNIEVARMVFEYGYSGKESDKSLKRYIPMLRLDISAKSTEGKSKRYKMAIGLQEGEIRLDE